MVIPFYALWDTGATGSMITQAVVEACRLEPRTETTNYHVGGSLATHEFVVNIWLPSHACFSGIRVTRGELHGDADVLIGMDIITRGDFAVTNLNGRTKFSFRVPSIADIDFAEEDRLNAQRHDGEA